MSTSPATTVGDRCDGISKRSSASETRLAVGAGLSVSHLEARSTVHGTMTLVLIERDLISRGNRVTGDKRTYCGARPLQKLHPRNPQLATDSRKRGRL
jgi:hypothetical protein